MKDGINVLSLCDGMSCGQIALKELGIDVDRYYASEIDKNAIKVTMDNFPNTVQLGDVIELAENIENIDLPKIDLVMFGSPCRSISIATAGRDKYNNGLEGASSVFYPCNDILQWIKKNNNEDAKFLVENVNGNRKDAIDEITGCLGVRPVLIDSNRFSAQNRERLYWTNIDIDMSKLPDVCDSVLEDILNDYGDIDEKYWYEQGYDYHGDDKPVVATLHINGHDILKRVNNKSFKCPTLTACRGGNKQKKVLENGRCRKLTPDEYRRLQTVPEWYRMDVADSHIYNMCGDGWTVKAIEWILSFMK